MPDWPGPPNYLCPLPSALPGLQATSPPLPGTLRVVSWSRGAFGRTGPLLAASQPGVDPTPSKTAEKPLTHTAQGIAEPRGKGREPLEHPMQILVVALVLLLGVVLWPVVGALVFGGFVAIIAWRPFEWLTRRLHGHRELSGTLGTIVIFAVILAPLGFTVYLAVREALIGMQYLERLVSQAGGSSAFLAHQPPLVRRLLSRYGGSLASLATRAAGWLPLIFSELGHWTAEAFLAAITLFTFFWRGTEFVDFLRQVSPLRQSHDDALIEEFALVARGLFWGNVVTALLHGLLGLAGYYLVGLPAVLLLGALTMFASFIPAIGTAVVWVPLALALWLAGDHGRALFLLGWGAVIIGGIDNIMRPLLSRGGTRLPTLLMFLTIYGGLMLWGLKGLLLGPLFGALAYAALRLVARENQPLLIVPAVVGGQPSPERLSRHVRWGQALGRLRRSLPRLGHLHDRRQPPKKPEPA